MLNKLTGLMLLLFLMLRIFTVLSNQKTSIKVLDIGQGDAILIRTKNGRLILIDGGPDFEVDGYLQRENVFNRCDLDLVFLTHPHQDHIAGLNRIIKRCRVSKVIFNEVFYDSRSYLDWVEANKSLNSREACAGDVFIIDGIRLVVLWPTKDMVAKGETDNLNNYSTVLLLDYGEFEALFLGDAEKHALENLDRKIISKYLDGNLELYKVSHHGSRNAYDESLLRYLHPELCVISVGEENKFGHPHQEAITALEEVGCKLRRTDEDGTIEVLIN